MSSLMHRKLEPSESFDEVVLKAKTPIVVDFYADWCGPCKKLGGIIEQLWNERKNFNLIKVNVDEFEAVAEKYEISSIPVVMLFINGQVVKSMVGSNAEELKQLLDAAAQ